ncbi:MAG: tetratricopeptide repeat protein [Verrucomicrobiota bacterium]
MRRPTTQRMQNAECRMQKVEVPLPPQAAALTAQSEIGNRKSQIPWWLMGVLLVLGTVALYWPATRCDFVNLDDSLHVTSNVLVQKGLTWEGIRWVLLHPVANNWHPLTVLSHMAVCQMCGLNPWGHHLANVLLHALNAGLVFALLQRMTGAAWRSLLVAALFAFHPLRVESVAWVTERKDVLSGFFGLLALIAYVCYAQGSWEKAESRKQKAENGRQNPATRNTFHVSRFTFHARTFYLLSLFFLALGLMSKPMLVTWPLVMLLLDYWPLGRMQNAECRMKNEEATGTSQAPRIRHHVSRFTFHASRITFHLPRALLFEKIPFFVLAALMSILTFVVQHRGGALAAGESLPLGARLGNAVISYCRYLGKLFWPSDLAVVYPHPGHWALGKVVAAAGLIVGISVLVWMQRRRHPFLLVGWLWYCGTLVPVSQVIQTGGHAMADRWTYVPSLGILILAIWGAYELVQGKAAGGLEREEREERGSVGHALARSTLHASRSTPILLSVVGGVAVFACLAMTRHQLGYWRDSEVLLRHAIEVTENNELAHRNLGVALYEKGQTDEAIRQFEEGVRLKPDYAYTHYNLGIAFDKQGQVDKAIGQLQEALRLEPDYADARYNLGVAFFQQGRTAEAIGQFRETIRLQPDHHQAHNNLGTAVGLNGQTDEAIRHFQEALRLKPDYAEARTNLAVVLATKARASPPPGTTTNR